MTKAEPIAWVLNLDAELELIDPAHRPSSRLLAETRSRARALVPAIQHGTGRPVCLLGEPDSSSWPPPRQGDCWCPTPSALQRLRAAGVEPPKAPPPEVLRRVNHRAFAAELGQALPDAGFVSSEQDCLQRLARAPQRTWVLKRPLGFSGRMTKRLVPERMQREARTWIAASMSRYGRGLQVEPWVDRVFDCSLHGRLVEDGSLEVGRPVALSCDKDGGFGSARLAEVGELEPAEEAELREVLARVAAALHRAGYFGPFGIDAFRWRDDAGELRFHPLSEINARYSMAWWTGMAPTAR